MSDAWVAFARDGDPGHVGLPKWPAFSPPERSTMLFGRDGCTVVDDPNGPARELWERLLARSR
jgi:para-nitrobenzyl esterase